MSDSWIAFHPAIEEPSNIWPSAKVSSSIMLMSKVTCCHLPRGSVKRKSAYFTSLSLISFMTSLAVVMECVPFVWLTLELQGRPSRSCGTRGSDGIQSGFPRPDPNGFFDIGDEDLSVADPSGLGGAPDGLDGFLDHVIAEHNLDLHFGKEIHDVFGAAIKLGMSLLPAETLGLGHRDALQPDLLQGLLHFVEFEGLDNRLDLLHRASFPWPAGNAPPARPRSRLAGSVPSPAERKKWLSIKHL